MFYISGLFLSFFTSGWKQELLWADWRVLPVTFCNWHHNYLPTFVIANLYITDPFRPKGKGDRLGDFESREGRWDSRLGEGARGSGEADFGGGGTWSSMERIKFANWNCSRWEPWRGAREALTDSMVTITTTTTTEPTMSIILRKTTTTSLRVNSVPTGSDRPLVGALDQATSVAGDHFPPEDLLQVQVWARDHPGHPPSKPSGRLWGAHWGARGGWLKWKIERNWNSQNCRQGQGRKRSNKDLRSESSTSNSGKNQEHSWPSPQHWWPQSPPCQRWWERWK